MNSFQIAVHKRQLLGVAVGMMLFPVMVSEAASSIAGRPGSYVPGEVLVKFKEAAAPDARVQSIGFQLNRELEVLDPAGLIRVQLQDGQEVEEALSVYGSDPNVEYVQPNYIYTLQTLPNDPMFGQLWGLRNTGQTVQRDRDYPGEPLSIHNPGTPGSDMNMASAWDLITDCSSIIVGVIDSGINYNHEDLAANLWNDPAFPNHGWDFVNNTNDPMDTNGHGTHVAGTIGAVGNNRLGSTGVCWKVKLMALRACNTSGQCTSATEIAALNFGVDHGAKVINMSLGGPNVDQALSDAVLRAGFRNVVVVVAAGNEGNDNNGTTPTYPCNFPHPNIVCVAALDQAYDLAQFSNFGRFSVHVGAPGVNVVSTWTGAETILTDTFHTGGILNWTTSTTTSGGWAYGERSIGTQRVDVLLNPARFPEPGTTYRANTDDRAYKRFSLSGSVATLRFAAQVDLAQGDVVNVNVKDTAGDPFTGGTRIVQFGGSTDGRIEQSPELDITRCIGPTCMIGFQLRSLTGPPSAGLGILGFRIKTLQLNPVTYNVLAGTSMATPHVAGLAAMLRAFNPNYTVADVVAAIKSGGTPVAALAGKTTTGNAASAPGSLAYINAPTGVTASIVR
jgi:subtilisin family serine protease